MEELAILILGAGWTATFLIPLLESRNISFAATTTTGHPVAGAPTLPFKFDPSAPEDQTRAAIAALPRARHVLITFPLTGAGPSKLLIETYTSTHRSGGAAPSAHPSSSSSSSSSPSSSTPRFIQLGSAGIWQPGSPYQLQLPQSQSQSQPQSQPQQPQQPQPQEDHPPPWKTRHSPYATANPRAIAEDELRALGGCVLNLAGLWGGSRAVRGWAGRVAPDKAAVRGKGSLHLVHGVDVARVVVRIVEGGGGDGGWWERVGRGQRWMVTDGFVYDWWALLAGWAEVEEGKREEGGGVTEQAGWVFELMREEGVRALPRSMEALGRCYDTREFWEAFGLVPLKGRVV
ncbi:uncharacterized protein B0H64DRAFT_464856 [Chaetomium fimeti]|uniref:Uncharacterized protein n=1 Tax=Chaetomium fimeti TaxID=1854472 RepID=A0AAE0HCB6_9PEZI|nr:hypothetical protein B0H64DRAFT_464856 [Chaetomium fimeti]